MTGGIIMAGVPGNAWRAPSRAPSFVDDRGPATSHPAVRFVDAAHAALSLTIAGAKLIPKDGRTALRMVAGTPSPKDSAELGVRFSPKKPSPKIAPPKVGCKVMPKVNDKDLTVKSTRDEFAPRHRGQLGQDDPESYLSNGARPGEPASSYPVEEEKEFGRWVDKRDPELPADCNPRVQTGPGREMAP